MTRGTDPKVELSTIVSAPFCIEIVRMRCRKTRIPSGSE